MWAGAGAALGLVQDASDSIDDERLHSRQSRSTYLSDSTNKMNEWSLKVLTVYTRAPLCPRGHRRGACDAGVS